VHWPLPDPTDERKVSSTISSFFQMNNVTASGLISPHYTCSPTLQLVLFNDVPPLDDGAWTSTSSLAVVRKNTSGMSFHWMAKRLFHWRDIFHLFSVLQKNVCLGTSFLDITVPTAFVLQPHKWSKIFGLKNHLSVYTVTLPFYHTTCQQHWTPCCVLSW
jgi:hypothetical protein